MSDFFEAYFSYVGISEVPPVFHRWAAVSAISAQLGRSVWCNLGHHCIYPNQYVLLTGGSGTRKGSAIKIATKLLRATGYAYVAPNKAAKEALWKWMNDKVKEQLDKLDISEALDLDEAGLVAQAYLAHDEFLDFIGSGDEGLATNLTTLWDNPTQYEHPKTRGSSVTVPNPTINILSGITPSSIGEGFKKLAGTGGFFGRVIFIYSKPSTIRVTFPPDPCIEKEQALVTRFEEIKSLTGPIVLTAEIKQLLEEIYHFPTQDIDPRSKGYSSRRLIHLLKLITALSAADLTLTPTANHVILANTMLANSEQLRSKALAEHGKSRFSEVANRITEIVDEAERPVSIRELFRATIVDVGKITTLQDILQGLVAAEIIQKISSAKGAKFISNAAARIEWPKGLVDYSFLQTNEHTEDLKTDEHSTLAYLNPC